ncbi:MAG: hypothetical protein LC772_07960 [Chloroflexi bacterium]|nr:hypothetical protein [Chloroflexota bacterium]
MTDGTIDRQDSEIESLLRSALASETPDGMKERMLERVRLQTARAGAPSRPLLCGWRGFLAAASVGILVAANLADAARCSRLQSLVSGPHAAAPVSAPLLLQKKLETEKLLALSVGSPTASIIVEISHGNIRSL